MHCRSADYGSVQKPQGLRDLGGFVFLASAFAMPWGGLSRGNLIFGKHRFRLKPPPDKALSLLVEQKYTQKPLIYRMSASRAEYGLFNMQQWNRRIITSLS